jgi:glutamate-1-semialdehyde 2,1-aminomutase
MQYTRSEKIFKKSQTYIPGGVNSPVRAFNSVDGNPIAITSGNGSVITDADGNDYIDFVGSWGPLILGHAHPEVVKAVHDTSEKGLTFGASTDLEVQLAEMVVDAVPSIEMVRFVNSGTEATMSAVRLARAYTERNIIIKFEGCYHGHGDLFLSKAGSGVAELDESSSLGVPKSVISHTITLPYNDAEKVENIFLSKGSHIAAVIVEPIAGNMGVILPEAGFLETLRNMTDKYGAVLIFDEVITGFRVDYGGAQNIYDISPDLTCLGKIIGGGLPVGAFGGRSEIMKNMAPVGAVYQAGTLSGNPVVMSAGIATLNLLKNEKVYEHLENMGNHLETIFNELSNGMHLQIPRCGSMLGLFFSSNVVHNWNDVLLCQLSYYKKFHRLMLNKGYYLPPSPYESLFISSTHTKEDITGFVYTACEMIPNFDTSIPV